jgi:uncharacterized membrane protein YfcA
MTMLVICAVAAVASGLTFLSGFGLGTLLLPAFALFFPVEQAVALTAVVHLLNSLFKVALIGGQADRGVVLRFGLPAIAAAIAGAWVLQRLGDVPPLVTYDAWGRSFSITPVKGVIGFVLLAFAAYDVMPGLRGISFGPRAMPIGGLLSGFFGGLSGMQGALRSAFLVRAGLSKESFVATGGVIACLIDLSRLGVYATALARAAADLDAALLAAAIAAAFGGALVGNRYLRRMTMASVQRIVAGMLAAVAIAMIAGLV